MSNIDKRALREVAENAKSVGDISRYEAMTALTEFEAAAKPATVLALLDELEPMALAHLNLNLLCDVYRSAYEEARHDGLVNWEAASSLAEENEDLKRKLEAAEKRITDYQELISGLVGVSSSILREVERINKSAGTAKGE